MADYTAMRIDDLEGFYKGLLRKGRAQLGVESFGLGFIELEGGSDVHPDHDHVSDGQEEVFVVLRGTGELDVEGERVALDPEAVVRIGPSTKRRVIPGRDGIRLLSIGGVPGRAHAPPSYSELGSPDPMG